MPMPAELSAATAFLVGLLGSVHCVGMCGGIVGALTLSLPQPVRRTSMGLTAYLLAYNIGRITSYALAGALVGVLGAQFYAWSDPGMAAGIGKGVSGVFMIALGIYLAGWTQALRPIERAGGHLWRRIEPLGRRLLPVRGPITALTLGLVWGWLPCGLVYSALVFALTLGNPLQGAQVMVAFGLGTLPMLLVMGAAAHGLGHFARRRWVRRGAGLLVIAFAVYSLFVSGSHEPQDHHGFHP